MVEKGYEMRDGKWEWGEGEVEMVGEKEGEVVIVEVKRGRDGRLGEGEDGVERGKIRKMVGCRDG